MRRLFLIICTVMASVEICYSICLGDSITKEFVDPFHSNRVVRVISNDSIFESDEYYGLMFKILTDNTVEFTDYRNNSIRYDSLVIPEHVFVNAKQYTVVGIGEGCMSRSYYTLDLRPYDPDADLSYYGPSYLYIPSTVKYISNLAFGSNVNLKTVVFNEGLETIGIQAFYGCGITQIIIPSTVNYINVEAFQNCMSLESIVVSPDNRHYDSRNNCNAIIDSKNEYMFVTCKNTLFLNEITSMCVTNNVPKVKLGKKNQCKSLTVHSYTPKIIDVRRCSALKRLTISSNHYQPEIEKVLLPSGLQFLLVSKVAPNKIKGKLIKDEKIEDKRYSKRINYDPETPFIEINIQQ